MKVLILIAALMGIGPCLFADGRAGHRNSTGLHDSSQQFLLIIRYKTDTPTPSADAMKTIGLHWGQFIGELGQSGKLVTGYRPGNNGKTISGNAKTITDRAFAGDGEIVSSIFIIKAASMEDASAIAQKCPIYEMGGSVEIRPLSNMTN